MSKTEVVGADSRQSEPEMVCTENATYDEKSNSRTLAFSIDKIMSSDTKHRDSRLADRRTAIVGSRHRGNGDEPTIREEEIITNRCHRKKPEIVSRNDAVARYHLQQQKLKIANAMMLHMATESSMAPEVGRGLFPAVRHPEILLRQYHGRYPYHLPSSVQADRYRPNMADMTSLPVDPVMTSVDRFRLPVSSGVAWSSPSRNSERLFVDKSRLMPESLLSPARSTIWRKRDRRDVTDWSQMATGSRQRRRRPSTTGSQRSVASGCSAPHDDEEIVVDDDDSCDRKQFSSSPELPVQRQEAVNDRSDNPWTGKTREVDMDRSPGAHFSSSGWSVAKRFYTLFK